MNIVCSSCLSKNRVPAERMHDRPVCGKCREALLPHTPIHLNDDTFDKFIGGTDLPVVVDCWAEWCGPCRRMGPEFESAAQRMQGEAIFAKLDTEEAQHTAARLSISGIPTLLVFKGGQETNRQSGLMPAEQIVSWARS